MFTVDSEEEEDVTEDAVVAEDEATTTTAPEVEDQPEYCGQVLYWTVLDCTVLYCGQVASNLTLEEAVSALVRNPSLSIFADILRRAENVTDTIRYHHISVEY